VWYKTQAPKEVAFNMKVVYYVDMIISSFAKIKYSIAVLILSSSLGCASSPSTDMNSTQDRNPATHSASSGSGRQQEGHYDHQHDQDAPEGLVLGQCQVCFDDVTDKDIANHKAYACSQNHCVDTHCLAHQVKSLEIHSLDQVKELQNHGLSCCGEGGKCKERIALDTVKDLLEKADREALSQRLIKIEKSASSAVPSQPVHTEVSKLSQEIEGAFNLCCPASKTSFYFFKEKCGATLDKIEGCNAAECSNEACKSSFCYLCLEPQKDKQAAHAHALGHSGDYWEMRPGFTDRYHWQITRKKLKKVLKGVNPKERQKALEARKDLLEEKYFWPMPAGMKTKAWIKEVEATPESTRKYYVYENHGQNHEKTRVEKTEALHTKEKKIELLQNEYIFRQQQKDSKSAKEINTELKRLGAPVYASLDTRDAEPAPNLAQAHRLIPVMENDPRVNQQFARLGNMYEAEGIIFSGVPPRKMTQPDATEFCHSLGEGYHLPTKEELTNFCVALGYPDRYNPRQVPDQQYNGFWTSTVNPKNPDRFYNLEGYTGAFYGESKGREFAVRCVRSAR
jgi:hypothetical protein